MYEYVRRTMLKRSNLTCKSFTKNFVGYLQGELSEASNFLLQPFRDLDAQPLKGFQLWF
jgi:hypothetical protein